MAAALDKQNLIELLAEMGRRADPASSVEVTIVGGSAGILTGQLETARTTTDCDIARTEPEQAFLSLRVVAEQLASERGLSPDWFSNQVAQLDVLPSGWRKQRVLIGTFGPLTIWCVGRIDLLAMKVYAGRMEDRADVLAMKPTRDERVFIRRYLDQLRVPSRQANLDQVQAAVRFLDALEAEPW